MPQHPVALITERVRERVRREGVDLSGDRAVADRLVRDEVQRYSERALGGSVPMLADEHEAARRIVADLVGLGPLQPFLDDPNVEEIWINAPDQVYIAGGGASERTGLELTSAQVRDLVERMLQTTGRRVDLSSPFVDASLPDGSRLHVAIPDVTRREWAVNIRKFSRRIGTLADLVERGSMPPAVAEFLRGAVRARLNIIVSGATHAGKTTLLGALLAEAGERDRIITVEETFELDLAGRDVVAMQCRQPSLEGTGEITLRRLIKESLRMRPDRLVVGEVREAEALDLLIALNSGVPGACSVHANSASDALTKLSVLPLLAGRNIDSSFVLPTVAGVVDLVVHCEQGADGHRRVAEIAAPTGRVTDAAVEAVSLFATVGGELVPTGLQPPRPERFGLPLLAPGGAR
ncbi:ATPase, T2SS/T4P/T4SS family [Salinibacterium sp. SYSU T00001]|uniref:CpaF family protein n=1 Tax=Homoserinimonas sedimenticola TaxID=2986805 RepID=UPI002235F112|nr:ATPase, T2SS/T4P/T4SS family [Salinibacterium sedimenticola]MCW4386583.1 ATPase, T2SS/T4P/T4SS family [Salinibacterium sedimenticola]